MREKRNDLCKNVVSNPTMAIGYANTTHSDTTVAADNRNHDFGCKGEVAKDLSNKSGCADDIKGGNTEDPAKAPSRVKIGAHGLGMYLLGSKTPCFLKTSATIGTVELTGLEMTKTNALGAVVAMPVARSRTIPALILSCMRRECSLCNAHELTLKRSSLQKATSSAKRWYDESNQVEVV